MIFTEWQAHPPQIAMELVIVMPTVRVKDNLQLRADTYQVEIKGAVLGSHELQMDSVLALDSDATYQKLEETEIIEPVLGTMEVTRALATASRPPPWRCWKKSPAFWSSWYRSAVAAARPGHAS